MQGKINRALNRPHDLLVGTHLLWHGGMHTPFGGGGGTPCGSRKSQLSSRGLGLYPHP